MSQVIFFQRKTPQDTFLQFMKVSEGLCILTIKPLFDNYFVSKYNSCTLQVSISSTLLPRSITSKEVKADV